MLITFIGLLAKIVFAAMSLCGAYLAWVLVRIAYDDRHVRHLLPLAYAWLLWWLLRSAALPMPFLPVFQWFAAVSAWCALQRIAKYVRMLRNTVA